MRELRKFVLSAVLILAAMCIASCWRLVADDEINVQEQAAHRARMQVIASSIHLYASPDRGKSEVSLKTEPVLRYSDSTRKQRDSGLWIWGTARPAAIMAIEYYPKGPKGPRWLFEIASLSANRIAADHGTELNWTAKQPGLNLRDLDGAPAPADKPVGRLAQVRQLQRRFAASEQTPVEGRIELRSVPAPIHRYTDESAGVIDGVIMSFANGTNPEVLLVLEASQAGKEPLWQFALVQMTGGVVAVELGGKEIWQRDEADPPAVREGYVNGWISTEVKKNK